MAYYIPLFCECNIKYDISALRRCFDFSQLAHFSVDIHHVFLLSQCLVLSPQVVHYSEGRLPRLILLLQTTNRLSHHNLVSVHSKCLSKMITGGHWSLFVVHLYCWCPFKMAYKYKLLIHAHIYDI
mgnify:CR=1 FL=1